MLGSKESRFCLSATGAEFVLYRPVFDVQITARCGFQKSVGVFEKGAVKKLRAVGMEVVTEAAEALYSGRTAHAPGQNLAGHHRSV